MTVPVLQSSTTFSASANAASFAINKPTGTVSGDLLLLIVSPYYAAGVVTLAGWTALTAESTSDGHNNLQTLWKIAGGSEPSSYTFSVSGTSGPRLATLLRISGADNTTPFAASNDSSFASTSSPISPSVTATTDNLLICAVAVPANPTFTSPSGMSAAVKISHAFGSFAYATETPASGATGTRTWSITSGSQVALTIAIAPPSAGGGGSTAKPVVYKVSNIWTDDVIRSHQGSVEPMGANTSINMSYIWNGVKNKIGKSVTAGDIGSYVANVANGAIQHIVSTYSLVYTTAFTGFSGGVLALNGDVHFVPNSAIRGQKLNANGVISTYSLVYTTGNAYNGGVLDPNGAVHFVPQRARVGQKISANGTISTYSLVYTTLNSYQGGVVAPNGDIHFIPTASFGQKVSANGVVSTYSLVYTTASAYSGGVLAPNGDIHFVPYLANRGQKISANGVVSTYTLVYTVANAYQGGVIGPDGSIHFIPSRATVGQKISANGTISTYSLVYTVADAYQGGVLAPNGDIHFVPYSATRGQKISAGGLVSTYSLVYTTATAYAGGVLISNGEIHFIPVSAARGQKISTLPIIPFDTGPLGFSLAK